MVQVLQCLPSKHKEEFKPQYCKEKKERKEIRELQLRLPLEVAVGWFLLW
jgi:hypothetical protein